MPSNNLDPDRPYNELPPLPPARDLETPAILKACTRAARALAELKGVSRQLPDPRILLIMLPLQEARSSSAIENIITTTDKLFRASALDDANADPSTKEVLRYRQAMDVGERLLKKNDLLTTRLLEGVCSILLSREMRVRAVPGTKLKNANTGETIYTPPEGEDHLRKLLANLEKFIHDYAHADPLIKMGVIHYQFEAIHPFHDGNGRTGRILNILYLMQNELLHLPILYLSRYFIENRRGYYHNLGQVTRTGEWQPWILYMLKAVEKTARQTSEQIEEIDALFRERLEQAKARVGGAHAKEMLELVFTRPYIRIKTVAQHLGVSRQTARKYLQKWADAELLTSEKSGRDLLFINDALMELFLEEGEQAI